MEVLFGCGGDDVVVVGHEDDVVDEEVVLFHGFLQGFEDDAGDLSLVEPEGSVVGSADQVVGVDVLDDAQGPSHAVSLARALPKLLNTPHKVL